MSVAEIGAPAGRPVRAAARRRPRRTGPAPDPARRSSSGAGTCSTTGEQALRAARGVPRRVLAARVPRRCSAARRARRRCTRWSTSRCSSVREDAGELRYRLLETVREFGRGSVSRRRRASAEAQRRLRGVGDRLTRGDGRRPDFGPDAGRRDGPRSAPRRRNLADVLRRAIATRDADDRGAADGGARRRSGPIRATTLRCSAWPRTVEDAGRRRHPVASSRPRCATSWPTLVVNTLIFDERPEAWTARSAACARWVRVPAGVPARERRDGAARDVRRRTRSTGRARRRCARTPSRGTAQLAAPVWLSQARENPGDLDAAFGSRAPGPGRAIDDARRSVGAGAGAGPAGRAGASQVGDLDDALAATPSAALPTLEALGATDDASSCAASRRSPMRGAGLDVGGAERIARRDGTDERRAAQPRLRMRRWPVAAAPSWPWPRRDGRARGWLLPREPSPPLRAHPVPGLATGRRSSSRGCSSPSPRALVAHVRHDRAREDARRPARRRASTSWSPAARGRRPPFLDYPGRRDGVSSRWRPVEPACAARPATGGGRRPAAGARRPVRLQPDVAEP